MNDTNRIQDDATIASRYLGGQLSDSERRAYEQYIIENPDAVQELEATARMKVGLANLRETGRLEELLRPHPERMGRPAALAVAASIAMVAIGVALWRSASTPDGATLMAATALLTDQSGRPLAPGSSYALLRTRAPDYDALVELPATPQAIELRVRPESAAEAYRATLSRIHPDGSVVQIAAVSDLRTESDRFVRLYVDSSRLEPGPYLLVLSGQQSGAGEISTSAFRLKVLRGRGDA